MEGNKTVIIIAITTFVIGIILGNGLSGKKEVEQKTGAKQLLTQAIKEIEDIESQKNNLKAKLDQAGKSKIAKEMLVLQEELDAVNQTNTQLQDKIRRLTDELARAELRLEAKDDLRPIIENQNERITELENTNRNLMLLLEKIGALTKQPEFGTPEQPEVNNSIGQPAAEEMTGLPTPADTNTGPSGEEVKDKQE